MQSRNSIRLVTLERWHKEQQQQWFFGSGMPDWDKLFQDFSDDDLEALIAACDKVRGKDALFCNPGWVDAHLSPLEQSAMQRVVNWAREMGVQLWGTL